MINKRYFVVVVERNRTENRTKIEQCQTNEQTNKRTNEQNERTKLNIK